VAATFRTYFKSHPDFTLEEGVFRQVGLSDDSVFAKVYRDLRKSEGRTYSDPEVLKLPEVPSTFSNSDEWRMRRRSADRLVKNFNTRNRNRIIEIGCGNGWLVNHMARSLPFDFCGVDIGKEELRQAARLFGSSDKITFVFADIFSKSVDSLTADVFILAGAVQYFPDLRSLLDRLLTLLSPKGEIHILDSPFYKVTDVDAARNRSWSYFDEKGYGSMRDHYFHHSWRSLHVPYKVIYDPDLITNRIKRRVQKLSPFPWIRIVRNF
jgi:SAM-dependent methyltransferase